MYSFFEVILTIYSFFEVILRCHHWGQKTWISWVKRKGKLDTTCTLPRRGGVSLWSGDPSTASRRTSWPGEPDYMPWTGSLSSSSSSHRELLSQSWWEYTLTFFIVFLLPGYFFVAMLFKFCCQVRWEKGWVECETCLDSKKKRLHQLVWPVQTYLLQILFMWYFPNVYLVWP